MTEKQFAAVLVRTGTLNVADRTVEVVWATNTPIDRWTPSLGHFREVLSMNPKHIRQTRLETGLSVLDAHDSFSMDDRLGTVLPGSVNFTSSQAVATIRLSKKTRAEELLQDLSDGMPFPVSVGYRVHNYRELDDIDGVSSLLAVDWEPLEISAVPVPADAGAHSRAAQPSGPRSALNAKVRMRMHQRELGLCPSNGAGQF